MRQSEFRKKVRESTEMELEVLLTQEREGLYKMRQQLALKQLDNPKSVVNSRRNIARILGEIQIRGKSAGKGS